MTDKEKAQIARERAKVIVKQLRTSNEQAARRGAPNIAASSYQGLETTIARKLLRSTK
jgi:hypothetical protein